MNPEYPDWNCWYLDWYCTEVWKMVQMAKAPVRRAPANIMVNQRRPVVRAMRSVNRNS